MNLIWSLNAKAAFQKIRSEGKGAGFFVGLAVVSVLSFALLYWVLQIAEHPSEPLYLTAIYKYFDYTYFNIITRYL